MKTNKALTYFTLALASIITIVACNSDEKPAQQVQTDAAPAKPTNPFPFYKSIEIKPGYHFEVLSWGKGVDTLGGYLILMSDSVRNDYKSLAVEREGVITDAWNLDLDNDGNPEIYVQYAAQKNATDLNVYEFAGNGFDKIGFPGIKAMKGYQGNDKFFVKNGNLFRQVPLVNIDSGQTTTLVKTLKYNLKGNSFNSEEVKPE